MIIDRFIFKKHLEKGEKILYVAHKHWIGMLKVTLEIIFFGFLMPWILFSIGLNSNVFFWIAIIWSSLAIMRFLYLLMNLYSDAWLITDMNMIIIEWKGIFSNNSARIGYEDIEGASYEIKGFWGTIMRFGDMQLRVMSGSHFDLNKVANPKKVELVLMRAQEEYLNDRNMQDSDSLKSLIADMVAHHNKNK